MSLTDLSTSAILYPAILHLHTKALQVYLWKIFSQIEVRPPPTLYSLENSWEFSRVLHTQSYRTLTTYFVMERLFGKARKVPKKRKEIWGGPLEKVKQCTPFIQVKQASKLSCLSSHSNQHIWSFKVLEKSEVLSSLCFSCWSVGGWVDPDRVQQHCVELFAPRIFPRQLELLLVLATWKSPALSLATCDG